MTIRKKRILLLTQNLLLAIRQGIFFIETIVYNY